MSNGFFAACLFLASSAQRHRWRTILAFAVGLFNLTYADMGQYTGTERATLSVWKSEEEATLLLADAGTRDDLCGIAVLGARAAFTGGYTYLHRDVPLIYESELCSAAPANYVISSVNRASQALPSDYSLQSTRGDWGLYRRDGACLSTNVGMSACSKEPEIWAWADARRSRGATVPCASTWRATRAPSRRAGGMAS